MDVEIDNIKYHVDVIKKNNKNTYIRVKDSRIIVTTNYLSTDKSIRKLIDDNVSSIRKMILHDKKKIEKDNYFYYFGRSLDIVYGFNEIEFTDNKIYAKDEKSFNKYLDNKIYDIYKERLDYYYSIFEENIPIPNLKIRSMTTRWGVCNIKNHNVTLNRELYKYDICCLDYVIVHELSHFIHPNHSKDFWRLVEKYYPKYKDVRKLLKN